jgi:hypothetical protein
MDFRFTFGEIRFAPVQISGCKPKNHAETQRPACLRMQAGAKESKLLISDHRLLITDHKLQIIDFGLKAQLISA